MSDTSVSTLRSGRYAIVGSLGCGSQAETLDAVDKRDGRAVAIKRFQVRGAKSWKDVELAEREARVLATLRHPSLPVYIEHFEEDGALYLVMEKIEGETLSAMRRRNASFSNADIVRFLSDAESALGYLHARLPPLIHRDIKPGNVIRRADGSFALVDFGSVRDRLKPEGGSTVVGTFGYMAPEQFQGRALPGSDVYAVGATILSLVTGHEPEDLPHRGLAIDVPAALGPGAAPWLVRTLAAMLEPDPDRRPARIPSVSSKESAAPPRPEVDWQEVRDRSRAEFHRTRHESRRFRQDLKERLREEKRRARRAHRRGRRHGFGPARPLLMMVLVLALTLARLATWALFRVFLPTALAVLSLFFGSTLRRVAWRCQELGVEGDRGLQHAIAVLRGRAPDLEHDAVVEVEVEGQPLDPEPARPAAPKTRVAGAPRRVEPDPGEFDEYLADVDERARRERR